ncbi:MAG: hypothetical protein ACK5V4_07565, partial [Alphaproteobacteria bacterium]
MQDNNYTKLKGLLDTLENGLIKDSPWNEIFKWGLKTSVASFAEYKTSTGIDAFFATLRII